MSTLRNTPISVHSLISDILTMDSDPRKVPTARVLPSIDPREANELTYTINVSKKRHRLT